MTQLHQHRDLKEIQNVLRLT